MIGFVFQFHELIPELTILENVCLPGWIKKDNKVEAKAKDLLSYFGLIDLIHKKPSTLSGGEKQRVAIARSMINDPILFLQMNQPVILTLKILKFYLTYFLS